MENNNEIKKTIIFFKKGDAVRFPIIKAIDVPDFIKLPKNINTVKISNLSIINSNLKNGIYKLIGDFIKKDDNIYLNVSMIMEILDSEETIINS